MNYSSTRGRWCLCSTGAKHTTARTSSSSTDGTSPSSCTEAVLTEASHLLGQVSGGRQAVVDFFLSGGSLLVPATQASLRRCRELMKQYDDLPMDYADATLVVLAEELDTNLVFTTDRRDFGVYRISGQRHFEILPAQGRRRHGRPDASISRKREPAP